MKRSAYYHKPKNILIGDDSSFFRSVLSEILIKAGYGVKAAGSGAEVISEIENNADGIDLLLLDLQMPEMGGFEVLKWIQKSGLDYKFPVLVITGAYEQAQILAKLRHLGAAGLLTKSSAPEQIISRVNRLLFQEAHAFNGRVSVSLPVDFLAGSNAESGFFLDLSDSGAYLHTNAKLPIGSSVDLIFSIPDVDRVFNLKASVRWSSAGMPDRPLFGGFGVIFTAISEEERVILKGFIESVSRNGNFG